MPKHDGALPHSWMMAIRVRRNRYHNDSGYAMPQLPIPFLVSISLVGASIGLVIGLISLRLNFHRVSSGRKVLPLGFAGLLIDALLGAVGFAGGVIGALVTPIPARTVTQNVGGVIIRETTRRFQHPYWVGAALAFVLAFVFEFVRTRRAKAAD